MKKRIGILISLFFLIGSFGTACNEKERTTEEVIDVLTDAEGSGNTDMQIDRAEQEALKTMSIEDPTKTAENGIISERQEEDTPLINSNKNADISLEKNIEKDSVRSTVENKTEESTILRKKEDGQTVTETKKMESSSVKHTVPQENLKETVKEISQKDSDEPSEKESVHEHTWEPVMTPVHYEAVTQEVWVEDVAAWTEEIPIFEQIEQPVCVTCGKEIEGNPNAHLNAVCRQWRNESKNVQVGTQTITHEAQGHFENQIIKEAYDDWVITGSRCLGCGAIQ